jgi:hypothetical protein
LVSHNINNKVQYWACNFYDDFLNKKANLLMGNLKQFTIESLAATREAWIQAAEDLDMPALDYEMVLDWAENHSNYGNANGDSFAYGIFLEGNSAAVAVVDIVYHQRVGADRGWLKMLSVKFSPEFAPEQVDANPEKLLQVLDIYAIATIGTIGLTGRHMARVVKLYGRNDSLMKLLIALKERLSAQISGDYSTKIEGRWLVISAT